MTGRVITNKLARAIREARQNGMKYPDICETFGVSISAARRHATDANALQMRQYERMRYLRTRQDPAKVEAKRDYCREYMRRLAAEQRSDAIT